jgi:hypothetical protein
MNKMASNLIPNVFIRKDVFTWLVQHDSEILKRDPGLLRWNKDSLETMIARRIATHVGTDETDPGKLWRMVFPDRVQGESVHDFIINRTLMRPRDVVQFCQKAVEHAQRAGRESVAESDILEAWEHSGQLMLAQIGTEYQHRYPDLGILALALIDGAASQPWSELAEDLLALSDKFGDAPAWAVGTKGDPSRLLEVLYDTGIVGVETSGGSRWFEEQRPFSEIRAALSGDPQVVVHPAFHRYFRTQGI